MALDRGGRKRAAAAKEGAGYAISPVTNDREKYRVRRVGEYYTSVYCCHDIEANNLSIDVRNRALYLQTHIILGHGIELTQKL